MTIEQARRTRTVNFVVVVAMLVLIVVGLAVLFAVTAHGAGKSALPAATQKYLVRLAWLSAALLAMSLLLLSWIMVRHVLSRLRPEGHPPTPYVDAWALAGKRLKVKAEPEEEEGGPDDADEGKKGTGN